jgi:hypothetical protein
MRKQPPKLLLLWPAKARPEVAPFGKTKPAMRTEQNQGVYWFEL